MPCELNRLLLVKKREEPSECNGDSRYSGYRCSPDNWLFLTASVFLCAPRVRGHVYISPSSLIPPPSTPDHALLSRVFSGKLTVSSWCEPMQRRGGGGGFYVRTLGGCPDGGDMASGFVTWLPTSKLSETFFNVLWETCHRILKSYVFVNIVTLLRYTSTKYVFLLY